MRYVATISKAHNYLRIHGYYGEFCAQVIIPFCRSHLYKLGKVPIPGTRKQVWKVTHVFARSNADKTEYRIPSSLLKDLMEFAQRRGYNPSRILMDDEPEIEGLDVEFKLKKGYEVPREGQVEWIDYQLADGAVKVNNASTGYGKTYMSLFTMFKMGKRTLVTIQPRYITTWINDISKVIDLNPEDILVWENASLPLLGENIANGLINPKIVILPMTRISGYLRNTRKDPHAISLDVIFKQINAGFRIVDESHESFHEISLSLMYGNMKKFLLLSATLKSDDQFTDKMYRILLPIKIRLKEPDPENYIDVVAYMYHVDTKKHRLKTMQLGSYNDMVLEQSILDSEALTNFYFMVADKAYKEYYLDVKEEGTKCLFFFSRINMSQVMLEMFRRKYPDEDFDTFLGTLDKKTPEKYLQHEHVLTTPGSCGTGKDIPGLVTVICFHTVFSIQRNKQMIGRLRELFGKFGGRITPRFVFPLCAELDKHKDCYRKRKEAFASKQKSFKLIDSNCSLT